MKTNRITLITVISLVCLLLTGCNAGNSSAETEASITESPTFTGTPLSDTPVPTGTALPTATSTLTPSPTPTPLPDLGSALVYPYDSQELLMDYVNMDTWIDAEGMHASFDSLYHGGPGIKLNIDCADTPYNDVTKMISFMTEIPADFTYGDLNTTHVYKWGDEAYLYFMDGNCRVEIFVRPIIKFIDGKINESTRTQLYGVAEIVEKKLQNISIENGIQAPSMELKEGLFDETFFSIQVYHWGEPHRSYSVIMDTKKAHVDKATFAIFDTDLQEFISRRDILNYPPLGPSLMDNLGGTSSQEGMFHILDWDADYELWIWVEDELVGIYPLEKYEQPK